MTGDPFTLWREREGSNQSRLQSSDSDVCKAFERARRFRRTASAVTGGFFKVFRFTASSEPEARRLIDRATQVLSEHRYR